MKTLNGITFLETKDTEKLNMPLEGVISLSITQPNTIEPGI